MPVNWNLIVELLELAAKYGVPAIKAIIDTWTNDMTPDEIKAKIEEAQARLKRPEEYFD